MISRNAEAGEDEKKMAKKYYKCVPSMTNPNIYPVRRTEIQLDLEDRIRETEDNIELAALVRAWSQINEDRAAKGAMQYGTLESRTRTIEKEIIVNFLFFVSGAATAIVLLLPLIK